MDPRTIHIERKPHSDRGDRMTGRRTAVALLDVPWLALESRPHALHIAGLMICEKPDEASAAFVADLIKSMRQHAAATPPTAPFNRRLHGRGLERLWPRWQDVSELQIDRHLRDWALPGPGGDAELFELVSDLHQQPLDLSCPPWEVHVIDGLADDRFAIYAKFHHALTDGLGALRLLQSALSVDSTKRDMPPLWAGPSRPNRRAPAGVPRLGITVVPRALAAVARARNAGPRARPYSAPRSVLNTTISARRQVIARTYPLDRLRQLATTMSGTLNDAVLTVCGTALRSYLLDIDALPNRSLIAAVPVSVRPPEREPDRGKAGNALSFAFTNLATAVADHRQRTATIIASAADAKSYLGQLPSDIVDAYTVVTMGPFIASQLVGLGAISPPMFNLAISNFAGPTERLYYNGAAVVGIYPISILQSGQALNITALSYANQLHVTFTACPQALPRADELAAHCDRALVELETEFGEFVGDD
jgi:diacylglycerol O-acyltransferase / wax synthase